MRKGPHFPSSVLNSWLATFWSAVALITVWVLPIGLTGRVVATALFAVVPFAVVVFWLGQAFERRMHRDD